MREVLEQYKKNSMMPEINQIIHRWEAFSSVAQGILQPISSEAEFEAAEELLDQISDRLESPKLSFTQAIAARVGLRVLVFDPVSEEIVQWIE